jgi:hypothetical protein
MWYLLLLILLTINPNGCPKFDLNQQLMIRIRLKHAIGLKQVADGIGAVLVQAFDALNEPAQGRVVDDHGQYREFLEVIM